MKTQYFVFPLAIAALSISANAATIAGSFSSTTASGAPLGTTGALDWRIWDTNNGAINAFPAGTVPLYNEKSGATALSNLTANFGTAGTGSEFLPGHTYTYSDGTLPTAETATQQGVSIAGSAADLAGSSFGFTVTTASTLQHTLTIYGAHTRIGSTITLSLTGATTNVKTLATSGTSTNNWIYTATFTPDTAGDVLTISYTPDGVSTDATNGGNRLRFGAAAVSAIPEPSSSLLLLGTLGALALRRRR